jgi:hypothetical protein
MPGDPPAEADLHDPKARSHECVSPDYWCEKCRATEQHQAQTHHRHYANGKRPSRNDGGPIQQEPNARQSGNYPGVIKSECQKAANDNGRRKTKNEFAAGSGEKRGVGAVRFCGRSGRRDSHSNECFDQPDG